MLTIEKINAALAKAGTGHKLVRSLRWYYYLALTPEAHDAGFTTVWIEHSIYSFRLDPDDFGWAAREINAAFVAAGEPAPISIPTEEVTA